MAVSCIFCGLTLLECVTGQKLCVLPKSLSVELLPDPGTGAALPDGALQPANTANLALHSTYRFVQPIACKCSGRACPAEGLHSPANPSARLLFQPYALPALPKVYCLFFPVHFPICSTEHFCGFGAPVISPCCWMAFLVSVGQLCWLVSFGRSFCSSMSAILLASLVGWSCRPVLLTGLVGWSRRLVSSASLVDWSCRLVLLTGLVGWSRWLVSLAGLIGQLYWLALLVSFV